MPANLILDADHADLLRGSVELIDSGDLADDGLRDAINSLLRGRPSVADVSRVIVHLAADDFDYESGTAANAADALGEYVETLYAPIAR